MPTRGKPRLVSRQANTTKLFVDDRREVITLSANENKHISDVIRDLVHEALRARRFRAFGRDEGEDFIRNIHRKTIAEGVNPAITELAELRQTMESLPERIVIELRQIVAGASPIQQAIWTLNSQLFNHVMISEHVAGTREPVYRGFETIDSQRREMDLVRAQSESPRAESVKTVQSHEPRSLPGISSTAPIDRVEMQVPTLAIASARGQERQAMMNGLEREVGEAKLSPGHIDSDREWHFESLRDVLNPERSDGGAPAREYAERQNRNETLARTLDR